MGKAEESPTVLGPGYLLAGKYRLESELGRGAMGTVWLAQHTTLGQKVAIKVISAEHADSDELRRRFDTEARAAAKLRSRFVVAVHDHGETAEGLPYIVMEYLEGECLEDRIARVGALPLGEAATIARHIGRALSKAHPHGIVHRDLKPANIYISAGDDEDGDEWIAKVLDFGIAKMDDFGDRSTTKTGTVLGTPLFMSPEQVRGASNVDSRADLYSLGMVVYNMVTGTYAFEGQSFGDLLVSICTDPLPRLTDRAPNAPASLDDWFQKACARDREDRYQTVEDMMRGLSDALGNLREGSRLSALDLSSSTLKIGSQQQLAETFAADSASEASWSGVSGARIISPDGKVSVAPKTERSDTGIAGSGAPSSAEPMTPRQLSESSGGAALTVNAPAQKSRLRAVAFGVVGVTAAIGALALVRSPEREAEALVPTAGPVAVPDATTNTPTVDEVLPDGGPAPAAPTTAGEPRAPAPEPRADEPRAGEPGPNEPATPGQPKPTAGASKPKPGTARPTPTTPATTPAAPADPISERPTPSGEPDVGF